MNECEWIYGDIYKRTPWPRDSSRVWWECNDLRPTNWERKRFSLGCGAGDWECLSPLLPLDNKVYTPFSHSTKTLITWYQLPLGKYKEKWPPFPFWIDIHILGCMHTLYQDECRLLQRKLSRMLLLYSAYHRSSKSRAHLIFYQCYKYIHMHILR